MALEPSSGVIGFAVLFGLLVLRVPVGVALILVGGGGYGLLVGMDPLLNHLKTAAYWRFSSSELSVVPLFLLMGQFASQGGLSRALFAGSARLLGRLRGGQAMAALGACGLFGAICGSSIATAATMGRVALPELRRHGYASSLATGALAAGGTLGILIPPSMLLVIYAILTEQNIRTLFLAALLPGGLALLGYLATIAVVARLRPESVPEHKQDQADRPDRKAAAVAPEAVSPEEQRSARRGLGAATGLFVVVLGGLYGGVFNPTEAAAVGAVLAGLIAWARGGLAGGGWREGLLETAKATAMIFVILLGADLFNSFLALTRLPLEAAAWAANSGWPPLLLLAGMLLAYLLFGCVMDSLAMILLTIPVFFPVVLALDFGLGPTETAIWFGILALSVVEIGLITPPVGLNVYIINSLAPGVPLTATFRGVLPFLVSDVLRIVVLVLVPGITLWVAL